MPVLRIFSVGLMISFLGSLPLGTLNIAAMQISLSDGLMPAFNFVCGAILVEMTYVRLSLVAMEWVMRHQRLFRLLEWLAILVILALAVASFVAAADPAVDDNVLLSGGIHRFWLGLALSAMNPVQIPFWFGWSTLLISRGTLRRRGYLPYILGIGLGTFTAHLIFIFGGRFLVDVLNARQQVLHAVIGAVFALTAIMLAVKTLRKKSSA